MEHEACATINEAGGVVLVQDPETAEFDGMPRSVMGTGLADYVLRPRELARAIYDYVTSTGRTNQVGGQVGTGYDVAGDHGDRRA